MNYRDLPEDFQTHVDYHLILTIDTKIAFPKLFVSRILGVMHRLGINQSHLIIEECKEQDLK